MARLSRIVDDEGPMPDMSPFPPLRPNFRRIISSGQLHRSQDFSPPSLKLRRVPPKNFKMPRLPGLPSRGYPRFAEASAGSPSERAKAKELHRNVRSQRV